ncbi:MAG: hypothetical protein PHD13_04970 [Methanocellales archaeon]|nr:hypothetical protein [Methanocellales archaeon]MDD3291860.1 hypothetical protein [Methanocellales archaeon]MDD5235503.1 hypothetical protein [Methanocellales archaeon]MDD5485122.1 hypothetical protein [Methanocellales archaeon]
MKKKKAIFSGILVIALLVSSFLGGAYSQYRYEISSDFSSFIPSAIKHEIRTPPSQSVDDVLLKLIEKKPAFSYNGDYETFKNDFERYKYISFGYPTELHQEFLNSEMLGNITIDDTHYSEGLEISNIKFSVIGGDLPGLIVKKKDQPIGKVVIVVPGHPSKSNPLDDLIDRHSYQKGIAVELAKEGYTVFAMGLRGFNTQMDHNDFNEIASMYSLSWYGFLTSDALIFREHISKKYDVKRESIGMIGLSTGGGVCLFASSIDKTIPYAIICGFFGSFSHNFVFENHCRCGRIPDILNYFDMRDYLIARAPEKVVVINGEYDTFSPTEAEEQFRQVKEVYKMMDAESNATFYSPKNLGHEYDIPLIKEVLKEQFNEGYIL